MSTRLSIENLPAPKLEVGVNPQTEEHVVVLTALNSEDPTRPDNWRKRQKYIVLATGILLDFNSTLGSSLPSNSIAYIAKEFDVRNQVQLALPISVYVLGFIFGPLFYGPLSETYGRKPVLIVPFIGYAAFTLGCALASSWPMLLVFRGLCGLMASSPIAIIGGLFADIYSNEKERGIHLAYFIAISGFGPCLGPLLSGAISQHTTWRWVFWMAFILAVATLPLISFMPETYQPKILQRRAADLREATSSENITTNSIADLHRPQDLLTIVLTRPFRLFFTEAIVFFSCAYLALIYGIFYLTFEAWPLAYQGTYDMSPTISGLAYLPFGIGNGLAVIMFFRYDKFLLRAQMCKKPWSLRPEYRRLPLACIGGPLWTISLFWIGWTAQRDIHWIVPILSGITLGAGFLLIFIAILNYLSDAYTIYSASAQSISSTTRSILGAALPLAAPKLFQRIGFAWGCSFLGFLSMVMIPIPFAFIYWGDKLRSKSRFCRKMDELREEGLEMNATVLGGETGSLRMVADTGELVLGSQAGSLRSVRDAIASVRIGEDQRQLVAPWTSEEPTSTLVELRSFNQKSKRHQIKLDVTHEPDLTAVIEGHFSDSGR